MTVWRIALLVFLFSISAGAETGCGDPNIDNCRVIMNEDGKPPTDNGPGNPPAYPDANRIQNIQKYNAQQNFKSDETIIQNAGWGAPNGPNAPIPLNAAVQPTDTTTDSAVTMGALQQAHQAYLQCVRGCNSADANCIGTCASGYGRGSPTSVDCTNAAPNQPCQQQ